MKAVLKQVDFVKLATYISHLEPGYSLAKNSSTGPAFENQAQIAKLAVDLTERAALEKKDHINRQELESLVNIISCRYDTDLHQLAKAACFNIIGTMFESRDMQHLFTSQDMRELRHLERLKKTQSEGLGIIYLINHSSHWDEFIFNTFLEQNGLNLPLFAAGQNMMATPSLTTLFMLGSYVIIRKGASRSYLSSLFHYCQALAEMGKPQGIFLEAWSGGARTRDGSLRYPRRLITIQGALATRSDVLIQPVVISYSRIPEDRDLSERRGLGSWICGHHIGREFVKNPWHPLKAIARGVENVFGRTYVAFGQSRFLSELKTEWNENGQDLSLDEYTALYSIKEIAKDKKIMTSQLAALGLGLALKRRSNDIEGAAAEALEEIRDYHQRVFSLEPDLEDFIRNHSLAESLEDGLNSLARRKIISRPLFSKKLPRILARHGLTYYATHSDRRLYSPSAKENLVVCGAGPWGYALVTLVGKRTLNDRKFNNSSLSLYDSSEETIHQLAYTRAMECFPDVRLPKNVFPTSDHTEAFRKATEVIVATPPEMAEELFRTIFSSTRELRSLILASRGFDHLSHRLTIQMAWEAAVAASQPKVNILALSGPFTPDDLTSERGGLWILAGPVKTGRLSEASLFKYGPFKVHLSDDPIGVQTAAALIDAYTLYGATLQKQKALDTPASMANFVREISFEAKTLSMALGGQPATFESDSPAWISEFIVSALSSASRHSIKLAALKGPEALKDYLAEQSHLDLWPDQGVNGYYAIHSAYLTAKHLSLTLPHLEKANQLFWG